jgi:hypothetical protein
MKVGKFKIAAVIAISLGVVVCSAIVYAQAIDLLAIGTISNSQLFVSARRVIRPRL